MEPRVLLLLSLYVWAPGVTGKVDHAELRGEHPSQDDIDNGECIPIPCSVEGLPTKQCEQLCNLRGYETICQPPANFCLCRHMVHGKMTLVSPDEVMDQPPDSTEDISRPSEDSKIKTWHQEPSGVIKPLEISKAAKQPEIMAQPLVPMKIDDEASEAAKQPEIMAQPLVPMKIDDEASEAAQQPEIMAQPLVPMKIDDEASETDEPEEQSETENDGVVSFQIFTVFLPIKRLLYESSDDIGSDPEPTADTLALGYETVNVHEGRLFWDFRYILTGLLLLMIGLVVYELVMCATQIYRSRRDLSVRCEEPEVKVKSSLTEKEKIILNV